VLSGNEVSMSVISSFHVTVISVRSLETLFYLQVIKTD
jgi:hypothetical protein